MGGVVIKLGLYCFKVSFGLRFYCLLNGVRFYSRVGLYLRGYSILVLDLYERKKHGALQSFLPDMTVAMCELL